MQKRSHSRARLALFSGAAALGFATPVMAEGPRLITGLVNELQTVTLSGNVRPEASLANSLGPVDDSLVLENMQLLLGRPDATEAQLQSFLAAQQDPNSPYYHQWLTAEGFGENFGPAAADVQVVVTWLQSHGFTVNGVQPGRTMIDFSGTAAQLRDAFHTQIANLNVAGVPHFANMTNPRIPAALSGVVRGIVSLHDFKPRTHIKPRPAYTYTNSNGTYRAIVPADLAKIYNFNPLFSAGISGQGQTVVVIENTNVYNAADWTTFRSALGLSGYSAGSFTQVHPTGSSTCKNPGVVAGNQSEATLDAEWASAGAPSAKIELASCADTNVSFGGLIALQNLLNGSAPPAIVSISYGECEAMNGATSNAAYNAAYQQAVSQGVSVYVSAGDEGASSCDAGDTTSTHGIGVSAFASTPYNVAVGGTDFGDAYAGTASKYWGSTNSSTYESALSYIPEIPWNNSCASVLLASVFGSSTTYGSSGFCNTSNASKYYLSTASGSGGPSGCATGNPSTAGVVGGTCKGYAKPSWQSLVGNPSDGVRDLPDISLFAANGVWGHYYVFCDSDTGNGGAACTGAPSGWSGAGGTSFAAPIMAAIQALVNQKQGAKQGNPNPILYTLARSEYGSGGSGACNSASGNAVSSACLFYDVTQGDMDVNCTGTHNCYRPSGTNGVLSTNSTSYSKAYNTGTGWDFTTGIGTVNVANLVDKW